MERLTGSHRLLHATRLQQEPANHQRDRTGCLTGQLSNREKAKKNQSGQHVGIHRNKRWSIWENRPRLEVKGRKTIRNRARRAKPSSHYISSLIRLQKLISQWVISIKRGFARQVVKYLRGNLSPQERWQAAFARQEAEEERTENSVSAAWMAGLGPGSGTWWALLH